MKLNMVIKTREIPMWTSSEVVKLVYRAKIQGRYSDLLRHSASIYHSRRTNKSVAFIHGSPLRCIVSRKQDDHMFTASIERNSFQL